MALLATLIGDVVGSRNAPDRDRLHARLAAAVDEVNIHLSPVVPLRITVGDEYQGAFARVGEAIAAAFRLRVSLAPEVDLRHGVGWGAVEVLRESPRVEDGPGWWSARAAIEAVALEQARTLRGLRTAYRGSGDGGPDAGPVNAALIAHDALLAAASPVSWSVLRGLLSGMSQREIAAHLDVSPSAVSQRVRRDGLAAVVATEELLGAVG